MDPIIITLLEVVGSLFLGIILIIALYLILQYSKIPEFKRPQEYKILISLLAGLAMLNFIMINLIGADILDQGRTLPLGQLAFAVAINLPFTGLTIWKLVIYLRAV